MGLRKPIRKIRKSVRPGRLKGKDLEALRRACFERDEAMCKECGHRVYDYLPHWHPWSYHMAHIVAKRRGGDNLENVRALCGTCHRLEHAYGKSMQKPVPPKEKAA